MGSEILELVLTRLRAGNFQADKAYPGQRMPTITGPVAAVHIDKADSESMTVTVEVTVVCPASMGGTVCEEEALRAAQILYDAGAACTQSGCTYDGTAKIYSVSILAAFTHTVEEVVEPRLEFQVYAGGVLLPYAVSFSAEQTLDHKLQLSMGETAPVGISSGHWVWNIRLEELIPPGVAEGGQTQEPFVLKLTSDICNETYSGCRWSNVRREYSSEGLRRIRTGIALTRKVV